MFAPCSGTLDWDIPSGLKPLHILLLPAILFPPDDILVKFLWNYLQEKGRGFLTFVFLARSVGPKFRRLMVPRSLGVLNLTTEVLSVCCWDTRLGTGITKSRTPCHVVCLFRVMLFSKRAIRTVHRRTWG